jgi:FkbM family methyltransferase
LKQVLVELFYEENWHYYQIKETKVQPDDIVIDCGGAEGAFSLVASTICKKCYVIEPSPEFKGALNLTFRGIDNVEILQCALSDEVGNGTIKMQGIMSSLSDDDAAGGASVKIETIDNLFYERKIPADYIKADLEGYDLKAIIGAKKTIQKYKPRIAITTYHHSEHAKLIGAYIKEIEPGYDIKVKGIYQETGSPVMLHAWFKQS